MAASTPVKTANGIARLRVKNMGDVMSRCLDIILAQGYISRYSWVLEVMRLNGVGRTLRRKLQAFQVGRSAFFSGVARCALCISFGITRYTVVLCC